MYVLVLETSVAVCRRASVPVLGDRSVRHRWVRRASGSMTEAAHQDRKPKALKP